MPERQVNKATITFLYLQAENDHDDENTQMFIDGDAIENVIDKLNWKNLVPSVGDIVDSEVEVEQHGVVELPEDGNFSEWFRYYNSYNG